MMAKRDYVDFQDRTHPLAYLITFRCYGTWLHGDERGSVDRRHDNRHDTPDMPANKRMFEDEKASLRSSAVVLNCEQTEVITSAIREVCDHVGIRYTPVNTRTNHVHAVASGESKPEHIMNSFKS